MRRLFIVLFCSFPLIAQAQNSGEHRMVVTPDGVFISSTEAPSHIGPPQYPWLGSFGGTLLPGSNPNPSPPGLRWTYPNPSGMPWISQVVSTGNHGTFGWLAQNLNFERLTLIALSDDQNPALPIWEDELDGSIHVAAADKAEFCAVALTGSSGTAELRYYSAFSSTPSATTTVPAQSGFAVAISDDGQTVAAGYTDSNGDAAIALYDPDLNLQRTLVVGGIGLREHDISADGSTVLMATHSDNYVFDSATGDLLFQDGTTVSHDAHSIDGDGDTWGRGGFDVGVWKFNGFSYSRILDFDDGSLGTAVYSACDVSADGSTFVAAAYDAADPNKMRVYCFELLTNSANLLWTYASDGSGTFQDAPQKVSISDDGRGIAVGSWGTEFGGHAECLVFDRDVGNDPQKEIDTPGSVFGVDLSGDGQFVVAGTKAVHANDRGNGGEGYSLDCGGQGHWLRGTPSAGRSLTLDTGGHPGDQVLIMAGLSLLPSGIALGGFCGTLDLDPSQWVLAPILVGVIPGGGTLSLPITLPAGAPVGLTLFTQTIRLGVKDEFDNFLRIPITP